MKRHLVRCLRAAVAGAGLLILIPSSAGAAGPQELPAPACNDGTATASAHAPTRASAEAIPHIEHAYPISVPFCHHFNPTADPPPGAPDM